MQDETSNKKLDEHPLLKQNKMISIPGLPGFLPRLNPDEMEQLGVHHIYAERNHFQSVALHVEYYPFMAAWYDNVFLKWWLEEKKMQDDFTPRIWFQWYYDTYHSKGKDIDMVTAAWMVKFWKKAIWGLQKLYDEEPILPLHTKQTFLELGWSFQYVPLEQNFKTEE